MIRFTTGRRYRAGREEGEREGGAERERERETWMVTAWHGGPKTESLGPVGDTVRTSTSIEEAMVTRRRVIG